MNFASGGVGLPAPEKENCVSIRLHIRSRLWQVSGLIFGAALLVACANPAPATLTAIVMTSAASAAPQPTRTVPAQNPAPGMDAIIPRPAALVEDGGTFSLSAGTVIAVEPGNAEVKAVGQYLADALKPATGYALPVQDAGATSARGSISLSLSGADAGLGEEGYQLSITPDLVSLVANQPAGLFYGVQSLRQLLPPAIDSSSLQPGPWKIGTGTITDHPRFAWRGAMLDVARHFFSVREVTRYIDLLAYYKINRLHLHLSDDQGWRIQINSWPNLTQVGGSLEVGGTPGGYYSQDDYAYIVAYARSRYIMVIPEIDMPGHFNAALVAYPELNCDGVAPEPYTGTEGAMSSICVNQELTYTFLENVIGELAALTPGPYIHIGGDEALVTSKTDYIKFVKRVQAIVAAAGKQAIGWEEIAQSTLLPDSIVQHWNLDPSFAVPAAQGGARVIMSPADRAYLDMKYDDSTAIGQTWAGTITIEKAYSWDPATLIGGIGAGDILGVEAPLWSETLKTLDDLEYLAFPRLLGYAEIGWSPQARRDWNQYRVRLAGQGPRLQALGVHFYPSQEIAWP